jgi:hypothetical protein
MCLRSRRSVMRIARALPAGAALVALVACDPGGAPTEIVATALRDTAAPRLSDDAVALIAELPRISLATTYPLSVREVHLAADADLQAAIDSARPGDALLLAPGATYEGNFVLPDKGASDAWITIRTDADDAVLGAPGARMTPSAARAAALASIVSMNANAAITTAPGAGRYRLVGLEVSVRADVDEVNAIVRFGEAADVQTTAAQVPHDLVIDRSYVHGNTTLQVRRCVMLNSGSSIVIDSWLGDCHSNVSDSQAIVGWNGPGPYLIENNHLEGGHEVIMFGGSGTVIANQSPADITIRGNHVMRPLAWKGIWQVKNLLETKHARRVLVEGNVFENNWVDAQAGFAILFKSVNQDNDAPWSQSTDITFRYNIVRNTGNGFNLAAAPDQFPVVPAARMVITDNVLENVNVGPYVGQGTSFQLLGGLTDVVITHNTVTSAAGGGAFAMLLGSLPRVRRLALHSNVLMHGGFGIKGTGVAEGASSIDWYAPGALVRDNVIRGGGIASEYPSGNYFVDSLAEADFVMDARPGFDGIAVGANLARVESETRGAVIAP